MDLLSFANWLFTTFPWLRRQRWVRQIVTRIGLFRTTRHVPSRPYPYAMKPDYTSWPSLTDRRITGRHLACAVADKYPLPDLADVTKLFLRSPGMKEEPCPRSSLLFAAFAQWFTDSFLRTSHGFIYDPVGNVPRDPKTGRLMRKPGREAFNDSNHEIDLCQIYGTGEDKTALLRRRNPGQDERGFLDFQLHEGEVYPLFILGAPIQNGQPLEVDPRFERLHDERLLRVIFDGVDDGHPQPRSIQMFAVGLEHGNVTLGNSLFNIIFLREHNRVAKVIGAANPEWDDERVFQTTRNVLIVILLKIVIADYISHLSPWAMPLELVRGYADRQRWYRSNRIAIEFNLLYRWHELIPNQFDFLSDINDYRHNNGWILTHGVEALVERLSQQRAGKITLGNTPIWLDSVQADTLQIMRGARLASYNDYRRRFGLSAARDFSDITRDPQKQKALYDLYDGNIEAVEWFVGMYGEEVEPGSISGELMRSMVGYDAFTHALTNPLLADGVYGAAAFSEAGLAEIDATHSLEQLVRRNISKPISACSFQA